MTFTLRKFLCLTPIFIGAGIVMACGPYSAPSCPVAAYAPPQPPQTLYYEPVTNPQGQTTYVMRTMVTPSQVAGTTLSVVKGKLQLQGADGSRMTCEKLSILVNGVEPAEVSMYEKLIKVTSGSDVKDGNFLQATAQKMTRTGAEGATLVLEGGAKLVYVRKGKKLEAAAESISVNLSTGQVVSEMGAMPAAENCVRPAPPGAGPSGPPASGYPIPSTPYYNAPAPTALPLTETSPSPAGSSAQPR